jgi:hypothetical protein
MQQNKSIRIMTIVIIFVAAFDSVAFARIWIQGWPRGVSRIEFRSVPRVENTVTVMMKARM